MISPAYAVSGKEIRRPKLTELGDPQLECVSVCRLPRFHNNALKSWFQILDVRCQQMGPKERQTTISSPKIMKKLLYVFDNTELLLYESARSWTGRSKIISYIVTVESRQVDLISADHQVWIWPKHPLTFQHPRYHYSSILTRASMSSTYILQFPLSYL